LNYFEGQSIRREELYEGMRGNRNPFDEANQAEITRNPLWMKQAEVEEEPMELQFWEAPNKGQVERDDDEVITERSYDPALNSAPKEDSMQHLDMPPLAQATPGASPMATPRKDRPASDPVLVSKQITDAIEMADLKNIPQSPSNPQSPSIEHPSAADFATPRGEPRKHRRIKSHDDEDLIPGTPMGTGRTISKSIADPKLITSSKDDISDDVPDTESRPKPERDDD